MASTHAHAADCSYAYYAADEAYTYARRGYNASDLDEAEYYARKAKNSALTSGCDLKLPPNLLVTVEHSVSSTPLDFTQKCFASMVTATLSVSKIKDKA